MRLAAIAETAAEAQSALGGGADFVIVRAEDAGTAASITCSTWRPAMRVRMKR